MSGEQTPTLRRIRTFALDVEAARTKDGQAAPTTGQNSTGSAVSVSEKTPEASDKVAAVKTFANVPQKPEEHIPAFHELQKKSNAAVTPTLKSVTAESTPSIKEVSKSTVKVRAKKPEVKTEKKEKPVSSGGTIITDTKTNNVGFIEAIILSVRDWFTSLKKQQTRKKVPTYTVTDVDRRKGVVQKATSKTGTIFTADNETLKEEIRRRAQTQPPTKATEPDISWSPNTETGFALLNEHAGVPVQPHNVTVEFKKQTLPAPVVVEPTVIPTPAVSATPINSYWESDLQQIEERPTYVPPAPPVAVPEPIETPTPPAPPIPPPIPVVEVPVVVPEAVPVELTPEEPLPLAEPTPAEQSPITKEPQIRLGRLIPPIKSTTNALTFSIVGSIAAVVILVIVARIAVGLLLPSHKADTLAPAVALVPKTVVTDGTLSAPSKEAVVSVIQAAKTTTPTEIRFVDGNSAPVKKDVLLPLLGFTDSKNFNQTVTDVHVLVSGNSRGVVLKVTDATTALGALLSWEPTMIAGLGTTLAIPIPNTPAAFTDKTIGGTDVRVASLDDTDVLVYGFINRDTVLITKSTADFTELLGTH